VCLKNDRRVGVFKTLFATVVATNDETGEVSIETEATRERDTLPAKYLADGHLDHGYATTIHKAQGMTCDHTLVLGDDRLYRQGAYTALSRGRNRNDLYVVIDDDRDTIAELEDHGRSVVEDPATRLVASLRRDGAKTLATDEAGSTSSIERFVSAPNAGLESEALVSPIELPVSPIEPF
jgi:ATP-dependent exoDNAse (exonuclease V) alpha subunit